MSLAENVKYYQEQKNMTTAEFASAANLPADTINKIRAGATQNPSMDTLRRMATALGCSIDDLAGMPKPDMDVRELFPEDLPTDPEKLAALVCKTVAIQEEAHKTAMHEVRKDRKWWRNATILVVVAGIIMQLLTMVMVARLYWDIINPSDGSIRYVTVDDAPRK